MARRMMTYREATERLITRMLRHGPMTEDAIFHGVASRITRANRRRYRREDVVRIVRDLAEKGIVARSGNGEIALAGEPV